MKHLLPYLFLLPLSLFVLFSCAKEDNSTPNTIEKSQLIGTWNIKSNIIVHYDSNNNEQDKETLDNRVKVEIDNANVTTFFKSGVTSTATYSLSTVGGISYLHATSSNNTSSEYKLTLPDSKTMVWEISGMNRVYTINGIQKTAHRSTQTFTYTK